MQIVFQYLWSLFSAYKEILLMVVRTYIHSFHHNIGTGSDNSMILHTVVTHSIIEARLW